MIIIENTETLELVSDSVATTNEPSWVLGLVTANGPTYIQSSSETGTCNGTTAVTMSSGVSSQQKRITVLSVFNRDTVEHTVTLRRSATLPIIRARLLPNWVLRYESGNGFLVFDDEGRTQFVGNQGPSGAVESSFESVAENISAYPFVLNYTSNVLTSIVYTTPSGTVTKTFNYTSNVLTSIVLSGPGLPLGINLTKTYTYTSDILTSISYS